MARTGVFLLRNVHTDSGPTQPPTEWVLDALSPDVKRPKREADHSSYLVQRLRIIELYVHSPIRLHGVHTDNLTLLYGILYAVALVAMTWHSPTKRYAEKWHQKNNLDSM
jgi:hypothetical protein